MTFQLSNLKYVYRFLSAYIFVFIILYLCFPNFKNIQNHRSVLYLSTLLFIGCSYILFVNPKYFKLGDEYMPKWMIYSFYIIFHILPFILVVYKIRNINGDDYNKYNILKDMGLCIIFGLIYIIFFNVKKIYNINLIDILTIILITTLIFYILEFILIHHHHHHHQVR